MTRTTYILAAILGLLLGLSVGVYLGVNLVYTAEAPWEEPEDGMEPLFV